MHTALIALGGNLGNVQQSFDHALKLLSEHCIIVAKSKLYLTPAIGPLYQGKQQPDYLNGAIKVTTTLTAQSLLTKMHEIEAQLGRKREKYWGARTLDLDLLAYESETSNTPQLLLPHPRIQERLFVLQPMHDIQPDWVHPTLGVTLDTLISQQLANGTSLFEGNVWT